jgi:hypothetical protein
MYRAVMRRVGFDPVRLVVDEVTLEQIFIQVRSVSPVNLHITIASFSSVTVP